MRLRIIKVMRGEVDGVPLAQFRVGETYDVGTTVGSYLLALRAAVPVIGESSAQDIPVDLVQRDRRLATRKRPRKTR